MGKVLALKLCGPNFLVSPAVSGTPYGLLILCCMATKVASVRQHSPFLRLAAGFLTTDSLMDFKGLGFPTVYTKSWVYAFFLQKK